MFDGGDSPEFEEGDMDEKEFLKMMEREVREGRMQLNPDSEDDDEYD